MPITEIAGERAGQQPIDRASAAAQRFLGRPDQDQGQPLLVHPEVGPQIDGAAGRLADDRDLWSTIELKASLIDGAIATERETDLAA
jgi:hypothetical protein